MTCVQIRFWNYHAPCICDREQARVIQAIVMINVLINRMIGTVSLVDVWLWWWGWWLVVMTGIMICVISCPINIEWSPNKWILNRSRYRINTECHMQISSSLIIMLSHGVILSQTSISNSIVCSTIYQSLVFLSFHEDNPQMTGGFPHKGPVMWKKFHVMISLQ